VIQQREDGCGGADTERERHNRGGSKAGAAPQETPAEPNVL
jgi:hypothetical protein